MAIKDHARNRNIDWNIDTKDWDYKKPSEVEIGKAYPIHGIFITPDNGYGKGAVLICDNFLLNAPSGSFDYLSDVLKDDESIQEIRDGKVAAVVTTFVPKKFKNTTGYSVELINI